MHNRMPSRRRQPGPGKGGNTLPAQGPAEQPAPRMPHERDESADSQSGGEPSAQRTGQIGHDDLERGLVDTDKGPELERANEQLSGGTVEAEKKFSPGAPPASRE